MSYSSLLNYCKDIANNLVTSEELLFFHGRKEVIHELNQVPGGQTSNGIVVWSLPFISSGNLTPIGQQVNREWTVNIIFYKKDEMGSEIDQNNMTTTSPEIQVLQATDDLLAQFIRLFNYNTLSEDLEEYSDKLQILNFSTDNVIKDNDYLLTGSLLSMTVRLPDSFDYCSFTESNLEGELEFILYG